MSGLLLNSPAEIIGQAILDEGMGQSGLWPIFINNNQKTNTRNISVLDTAGFVRGKTHVDSESQEHYGIQFLIRGANQLESFRKTNEILNTLNLFLRKLVNLSGEVYSIQAVTPSGTIIRVGKEQPEEVLFVFSLNAVTSIRLVT
jgi:hypothetical protein